MKNKKYLAIIICLLLVLASCTEKNSNKESGSSKEETKVTAENVKVGTLKGFPGIGMVNLMEENEEKKSLNNYEFTIGTAPDELNAKLISGEIDIATIPTNMAATLYNKTKGEIQILAVNTLGVIKIVSTDENIKTLEDIKGLDITASGKGAIPEYTFEYVLNKKNIKSNITYYPGHEEVAGLLSSDKATIGTIPEPTASKVMGDNPKIHVVADLTDEWNKLNEDILLSQGCVVVNKKFAEENQEILNKFIEEYKKSCEKVHSNLEETAKNCGKFNIVPEKIAMKAIPESNQVFINGEEMKNKLQPFFQILLDANKESVGGNLPNDDFYYVK